MICTFKDIMQDSSTLTLRCKQRAQPLLRLTERTMLEVAGPATDSGDLMSMSQLMVKMNVR